MPVPIVYRKSVESAVASYDSTDVLNGTGIVNFYPGAASSSYLLSPSRFYSGKSYTTSADIEVSGAASKYIDLDFDVLINKPITLKGTCIASVPVKINYMNGTTYEHVVVYLRKWDGATETDIASGASAIVSGATTTYRHTATFLPIPTTSFKKGEYLRVTIEGWAYADDRFNKMMLGHDPQGVLDAVWNSTTVAPTSVIQLPFRIDL